MRRLAVVVPTSSGEELRQRLRRDGLLVPRLKVLHIGGELAFAVSAPPAALPENARLEEREFPEPERDAPASYRDLVAGLSADERALLPRAYDLVGDIVLLRLPAELEAAAPSLGAALLAFVPHARVVGLDRGVHGGDRVRSLERIAGRGEFATRHRENGLELEVDLDHAYFSPRLAREHARVAEEVGAGERVADLCCGIGPFSLLIAKRGRAARITAVDRNEAAIELLRRNAKRLGLEARIDAVGADLEAFLAEERRFDRAILNLPHEGIKYLFPVSASVEPAGSLHYYEMSARGSVEERSATLAAALTPAGAWAARGSRVVHPYSPHEDLIAYRFVRRVP